MQPLLDYLDPLVAAGGPHAEDFEEFHQWVVDVFGAFEAGAISVADVASIRHAFGDALSIATLQGRAFSKPYGYAGDFEIIDLIYQSHVSTQPRAARWDAFFQAQEAPRAVRNRKLYYLNLLDALSTKRRATPTSVLDLACGSCRAIHEWRSAGGRGVSFDCIDQDPRALEFARSLFGDDLPGDVAFRRKNVFRYSPGQQYALVWSAGLFDYFEDDTFVTQLQRCYEMVAPGGELVIGNFADDNPTRPYMEMVGDWHLHHRSEHRLRQLAARAGISATDIRVGSEHHGVNLFLHAQRCARVA